MNRGYCSICMNYGCNEHRTAICPVSRKITNLEAENKELKSENKKLMEKLERSKD